MKNGYIVFLALCTIAPLNSMDQPKKIITIICGDNQTVDIPIDLIPFMPTISDIVETVQENDIYDLYYSKKEIMDTIITCMIAIKPELTIHAVIAKESISLGLPDDYYITKEMPPLVLNDHCNLSDTTNKYTALIDTADFLGISLLAHAFIRAWIIKTFTNKSILSLRKYYTCCENINPLSTLKVIQKYATTNGMPQYIIDRYLFESHMPKKNNLNVCVSIADLITSNKLPKLSEGPKNCLTIDHNVNVTDYDGIDQIPGIASITELRCHNNKVEYITKGTFAHLTQLTTLSLYGNQLEFIHPAAFEKLTNLQELYINKNKLNSVSLLSIKNLTQLKKLYLDRNQLTTIEPKYFKKLTSLNHLILSQNKIQYIHPEALKNNHQLNRLDLSQNPATSFNLNICDKS